jgi:hypothetical protein
MPLHHRAPWVPSLSVRFSARIFSNRLVTSRRRAEEDDSLQGQQPHLAMVSLRVSPAENDVFDPTLLALSVRHSRVNAPHSFANNSKTRVRSPPSILSSTKLRYRWRFVGLKNLPIPFSDPGGMSYGNCTFMALLPVS